jgi:hypothetical protein
MQAWPSIVAGITLIICCVSFAAEDARFAHPFDKDHPAGFSANFRDRAAWEKRADFLRHQALVALGLWPLPEKTPLNAVIHGRIDRDEYTVEKVFFASMPGHYVSGNLYRPKNRPGKLPAVLCPYGHWPNGRFIWRSDADVKKEIASGAEADPIAAHSPLQANCAMLARMGCVVFQYDMVGYCDSTKIPHREGFLDAEAILRLQSFMGLQTWNSIRSLDFVLSLPEVDSQRVAVTGSSSGGTQTIALCAVDSRPEVSFPMVMISMNMQGGCVCENAPLYRVGTNNVELASLFAPKPEGAAAANDWTSDFVTRGLPEMKSIWRLFGAIDAVEGRHVDFPHNHNLHSRLLQYEFLNKHLKLGWQEPVQEKPFEPVPPSELSVYDGEHPVPSDALDAAGLRKSMTRASDAQLDALAADREAYAKVLRVALESMVVDSMPAASDVEIVESTGRVPLESAGEWTGLISRKGCGERVPCKAIFPANWNGQVLIWADPGGCASVSADQPAVKKTLDEGAAVVAIDSFMSGTFRAPPKPEPTTKPKSNNPPYAAYTIGYNRCALANRVHDLLTAIAMARGWDKTRTLRVAGFGQAGVAALLARILAGDSVDRAAIDLGGFDFHAITDDADPMLLPGALKYGGICGFVPLCSGAPTLLCNAPSSARFESAAKGANITLEQLTRDRVAMIDWLMQQR